MKGVFGLASAGDLFRKLEWEYGQLRGRPNDPYLAYNFFVTAWHLLEWLYPDTGGRTKQRGEARDAEPLLQVCEHLAVGAKHFEPIDKRQKSVRQSGSRGAWADGVWAPGTWADGVWASNLVVVLEAEAAANFGATISVAELAERVMAYWRRRFPDAVSQDAV